MCSNSKFYTVAGANSHPNNVPNLITEPRQKGILSKVDDTDLHILESIPDWEDATALLSYLRYVFFISNGVLMKMDTFPYFRILLSVSGWENTKLIAGTYSNDGAHIFLIQDGVLYKVKIDNLEIVARDTGWEDARLMAGIGPNLYIINGRDLINIDAETLQEKGRVHGWSDATLLTVPGNTYIYIVQNGELFVLREGTLEIVARDTGSVWENATLLAGSGLYHIFVVSDGELIKLNSSKFERVNSARGWGNATLMSTFGEVYLVTKDVGILKNPEQVYPSYTDYSQHKSMPRAPYYYPPSYYPYNPYYPYFFTLE
ncbi:TPA: hypothetical protein ACVG9G_000442 [Bacillus thuringiensis]